MMPTLDPTLTPIVAAVVSGLVGGLIGAGTVATLTHFLTKRRDQANKARNKAVEHLISAFRTFSKANGRKYLYEIGDEIQQAVADVHLFGRTEEIALVQKFALELRTQPAASLDKLLDALRKSYRDQVGLPAIDGEIHWLRIVNPHDAKHMRQRGDGK